MKYSDLLKANLKYGISKNDIIKYKGYEEILENVVIAPWWSHEMFDGFGLTCKQVSNKVYNLYNDDVSFSFVELKSIGAPVIIDRVLSLGVTKCKNLLFIGSVGSLDDNIKIGDIVIPKYSICGDGASRYLNSNFEDEFLKKEYPSKEFTNKLLNILNDNSINYHNVPNYSTDSIFAQFYHLDKILELGCKTIEMESANIFKCNELLNINVSALFCVSDNTVLSKSLYSGRTSNDKLFSRKVRHEIIPKIIIELFKRGV